MTSLGTMEWACKEIKASLPLHYRSSNSYHSNKLVKMALLELEDEDFMFQGYYLMQQGGVISFSDSESFLVRIANISGLQKIVQCIFCKKSQVNTLRRMFDPFLPFHFHHNFDHMGLHLIELFRY